MFRIIKYVMQQILWIVAVTMQLINSMGIGIKWIFMTIRCVSFGLLDMPFFMPHVLWYLLTPTIIRRVAYRSSRKTKIRNMEKIISRQLLLQNSIVVGNSQDPHDIGSSATRETLSKAISATMQNLPRKGDLELPGSTAGLLSNLNPADGSLANGLPVDVRTELNNLNVTNNSFEDAMMTLQRLYQTRQKEQQLLHSSTYPGSRDAPTTEAGNHPVPPIDTVEAPGPLSSSLTDSDDEEDEEDKMNLHNRATLDIFLPVPLDTLFRFMDQETKSLQSHHRPHLRRKKFPVVILINGGAWIIGCYFWNVFLARVLAARGYVVFCPDYRNFPQTTMEGMTLDVSDAIAWVLNNAERYNGDLDDVTLLGQSAGAHLTMMSLISQAQLAACEAANGAAKDANVPAPSDVAYNVPRYNPRKSIKCYIGLSGIYNVKNLVKHFDRRGLYRNVLYQIAGNKSLIGRYTLSYYFDDYHKAETGEVLPDNVFDFLPQHMYFLHGDADKSAPVTESANLVYLMRSAQRDYLMRVYKDHPERIKSGPKPFVAEYILVPNCTHTDAIIEEPVYCGNSHVAEFLSFYKHSDEEQRSFSQTRTPNSSNGSATGGHGRGASTPVSRAPPSLPSNDSKAQKNVLPASMLPGSGDELEDPAFPVAPVKKPDGIFLTPLPGCSRPWLLRFASWVCPF